MAIQISGTNVIDNSRNLTNTVNITASGNIGGGIVATKAQAEAGTVNTKLMTPLRASQYIATLPQFFLGCSYQGGTLICNASNVSWIIAPNTSEVSRTWYARNDANTRAQQVSGCAGWFVPTITQLQNPGYTYRTFWDSFSSCIYWSSTQRNFFGACVVCFNSGNAGYRVPTATSCVRAFRCVTY